MACLRFAVWIVKLFLIGQRRRGSGLRQRRIRCSQTRAASQNRTRAMTARPSRGRTPRLPALPASTPTTQPHAEGARVAPHPARCVSCESWADAEAKFSSINPNDTCGGGRVLACASRFGRRGGSGRPRRRMVPAGRVRRLDIPAAPGSPCTAPLRARGRPGPRRTKGRDRAADTEG